eukprot:131112_1
MEEVFKMMNLYKPEELEEKCIQNHVNINMKHGIGDFYRSLNLNYVPINKLTDKELLSHANELKSDANKAVNNQKLKNAIALYKDAIVCLNTIKNPNSVSNNQICIILSNLSQVYLSITKNGFKKNKEQYVMDLLSALNHCQSSIRLNKKYWKSYGRKIAVLYRLGLTAYANSSSQNFQHYSPDSYVRFKHSIVKEANSPINSLFASIITKYQNYFKQRKHYMMLSLIEFISLTNNINNNENACTVDWELLFIAVADLRKNNDISNNDMYSILSQSYNMMYKQTVLTPIHAFSEFNIDEFLGRSISIVATILNWNARKIVKASVFLSKKKQIVTDENWERMCNLLSGIKYVWINELEWKDIVKKICKEFQFSVDITIHNDIINTLIQSSVNYIKKNKMDENHIKWKEFYEKDQKRIKHVSNRNILSPDGRLKEVPEWKDIGNTLDLGDDDLLNIHAIASSRKLQNVIKEIEGCIPNTLYHLGITWLHQFARNGCFKTVTFLIKYGMDVNITDRLDDHSNGKRKFWSGFPQTPLDFCVDGLKRDEYVLSITTNRQKVKKVIQTLRKYGGKKMEEMMSKKQWGQLEKQAIKLPGAQDMMDEMRIHLNKIANDFAQSNMRAIFPGFHDLIPKVSKRKKCQNCSATNSSNIKLKKCSGCKIIYYCSRHCQ